MIEDGIICPQIKNIYSFGYIIEITRHILGIVVYKQLT